MAVPFPQIGNADIADQLFLDDGLAGDLVFSEYFETPSAPVGGLVKVWLGSSWVEKPVKVWSGSAWVAKPLKFWSGASWVEA